MKKALPCKKRRRKPKLIRMVHCGKFASKHLRRGARHASDASKQYPAQTDGRTVSGMQAWRGSPSPPGGFFFCGYGFAVLSCSKKQFFNNNWFGKNFRLQATCHGSRPHVTAAGGGKVTARRAQNQQRSQAQQQAGAAMQSQSQIFSPSRQQSPKSTRNKPKPLYHEQGHGRGGRANGRGRGNGQQ